MAQPNLKTDVILARPSSGGNDLKEWWADDMVARLLIDEGFVDGVYQSTAPGDTTKQWYDTTTHPGIWKFHNGTTWVAGSGVRMLGPDDLTTVINALTSTSVTSALSAAQGRLLKQYIDRLVSLSGLPINSTHLGTFTGTTIPNNANLKAALQALETKVEAGGGGYTGGSASNTVFPVGSYVNMGGGQFVRNAVVNVYLHAATAPPDTSFASDNNIPFEKGPQLAGTWRHRGNGLAQRVA